MSLNIEIHAGQHDPVLPALRSHLEQAMADQGLLPSWTEQYTTQPAQVLIDGRVVWQAQKDGSPTNAMAADWLKARRSITRSQRVLHAARKYLAFLLALFIAFFPKCPFCWAAYMSVFGIAGAGTIPYKPWYLPVSIGLLSINIIAIAMSGRRHQYKPLLLTVTGAVLIVSNRLWWNTSAVMVAGICLLVIGSAWNSLPKLMSRSLHNLVFRKN